MQIYGSELNKQGKKFENEIIDYNFDKLLFKIFVFEGCTGNYRRDMHWHKDVEIFAVCEGELFFTLEKKKFLMHKGDIVILNPNEVHAIDSPKQNKAIVLQFPTSIFFTGRKEDNVKEPFIWFSHGKNASDKKMVSMISFLNDEMCNKERNDNFLALSYFYEILYLMLKVYRLHEVDAEMIQSHNKIKKLTKLVTFMENHYNENFTLNELADQFGYTPNYLSYMFRKYTGITFQSYLNNIRIEHIMYDIENSAEPIEKLAIKHGFANVKTLNRIFQKKYGMLPGNYRKNTKNPVE